MSASGARLGDRAQEGRDAAVVAAQLEDLLDHGAVLALELAGLAVHGLVVGMRLDLHAQLALRRRCAPLRPMPRCRPARATALPPPGRRIRLGHLGHGAHVGELVVLPRHQQDSLLVTHVDGERHGHGREDDRVVDRNQKKCLHWGLLHFR